MRSLALALLGLVAAPIIACSSSSGGGATTRDAGQGDDGATADAGADAPTPLACAVPCPASKIKYVVVIVQENHTFDNHFGRYCTAAAGSNPTCTDGPACCEAGPDKDPSGASPVVLDDAQLGTWDPAHDTTCETSEMNGGKMDRYAAGAGCSDPKNIAYADGATIKPYWDLAKAGAIADRYFQPIIGQSTSNNMYFARAAFVFTDNTYTPKDAVGAACAFNTRMGEYTDPTIGDLLNAKGVPWAVYAEGYKAMKAAQSGGACPDVPAACPGQLATYPCTYDPSDNPFQYYPSLRDRPEHTKDFTDLATDIAEKKLPALSFVKGLGWHVEYPGYRSKLSDGIAFATSIIKTIEDSPYGAETLVLLTYDEGGGYFDHVSPPPDNTVDGKPYGTRIPFIAVGPFAKKNHVSHVTMEHSSIVKFVEWNWLGKTTGQLGTRDKVVNNLGSVLDPAATGEVVPEQ